MKATRNDFRKFLFVLKQSVPRFAPEFEAEVVDAWYEFIGDVTAEDLRRVLKIAIQNCESFPSLKQLREMAMRGDAQTDNQIGQDIATKIETAISRFGYTNEKRAEEFLGPLGWAVVEKLGGWARVCEVETRDLTSVRKQWRELGEIEALRSRSGSQTDTLSLPPVHAKYVGILEGNGDE